MAGAKKNGGFTLLEMSVVIAIIAVIISGGMTIFSASLQKHELTETNEKLKAIQKAMLDFRDTNNRLPCPADVTMALSNSSFGTEAANPGSCIGGVSPLSAANFANIFTVTGKTTAGSLTISSVSSTTRIVPGMAISGTGIPAGDSVITASGSTIILNTPANITAAGSVTFTLGNNVQGMVPVIALHLSDDYAIDGWGNRIMYTVDNRFTALGALVPYTATVSMTGNIYSNTTVDTLNTTSTLQPHMFIYGSGIPVGDQIASITSTTALTLSNVTAATSAAPLPLTFSITPIPGNVILSTDTTPRITVKDQSGNVKTNLAAYVLVSFGPNGHGAIGRDGALITARINAGSNHPDELANCDCTNAAVSNTIIPRGVFVQEQPNQYSTHIGDPSYYFDDIVAFATRSDLRSPVE